MTDSDRKNRVWCCRCLEDFPVAIEPTGWAMGQLRPLAKLKDRKIRKLLHTEEEYPWLCGNCYFDLTDEENP